MATHMAGLLPKRYTNGTVKIIPMICADIEKRIDDLLKLGMDILIRSNFRTFISVYLESDHYLETGKACVSKLY